MLSIITELFGRYGYIVLYTVLSIELLGVPTPGETLMTYCGFLVFQGKLDWVTSIIVSSAGVITGITASYFIGLKLGSSLFVKYGAAFHMGPDKLEKASKWFGKYGNGLLFIAYFIPGVRHITGYFSGVTGIQYKKFAVNAYLGALLWTSTFISLGKILGSNWRRFHIPIKTYLIIGGITAGLILICVYLYRSYKKQLIELTEKTLEYSFKMLHSLGRVRIAIIGTAAVFVLFVILITGLVQDLLGNELGRFDRVAAYLLIHIFRKDWSYVFELIRFLTWYQTLIVISVLLFVWIIIKGKNRFLEVQFLIYTVLGGELLEELLRVVFHRPGPQESSIAGYYASSFPSEQALMAFITYGFASFIIIRHISRRWLGTAAVFSSLLICILSGLAPLFFNLQYPSDVAAGYVFGGAWLSINIFLLEVFRILQDNDRFKKSYGIH